MVSMCGALDQDIVGLSCFSSRRYTFIRRRGWSVDLDQVHLEHPLRSFASILACLPHVWLEVISEMRLCRSGHATAR